MRRLMILAMAVALLMTVAVGASATDTEPEPEGKVEICHMNGVSDAIPTFNPTSDLRMFYPGMLKEVPATAVPGHVGHGDSATYGGEDGEYRSDEAGLANIRISAEDNGLTVWKHADCFITRLPVS